MLSDPVQKKCLEELIDVQHADLTAKRVHMSLQQKKKLAKYFNKMKEELLKEFGDAIKKNDDANLFYFSLETLLYDCLACFIRQNDFTEFEELNRAHIGRIVEQVFDVEKEFNIKKKVEMDADM